MNKSDISSLQKYIWLDQKLTPHSPKYNIGGYAIVNGALEMDLAVKSLSIFSKRHPLLNSVFREENGRPFLIFQDNDFEAGIQFIEKKSKQDALDAIHKDFDIPFDLERDERLFAIWLIKIDSDAFIWYTKLHHLIADGYSFQLLFNELGDIYASMAKGLGIDPATTTNAFVQQIEKEKAYHQSDVFLQDQAYWKEKYAGFPQLIYHQQNQDGVFYDKSLHLSKEIWQGLQSIAADENISPFHLLLAGFAVVLSRFSFAEEINIGTPVLNRLSRADRKVFGPLINLLPLQIHIDADLSFSELSRQIKREAFRLLRHQKFQQADIIKALAYEGNRLYDVRISYERFSYQNEFAQHEAEIVALSNHSEEDPISVHIMDYRGEGLQFRFDVNGNYVPEYIADELVTSLQFIFENIADSVDKPIKTISVTAKEQLAEVKAISKGEDRPMAKGSFLELWRDNLHKFSSQKAIAYQDEAISYLDVNKRMKRLVAHLQDRGIGKGDRVAVLLDRSIDLIPTVLGVLQSGATYVPLDKTFPRERMALILKDSQVRLLLSDEDDWDFDCPHSLVQPIFEEEVGSTKVVSISPEDEAYIIYTSGSTGRPKGVSIRHESLIDYATTFSTYFRLTASDCVIQQSALVFDTSVEEIFPILTVGGKLLVAESPKDFHSLLQECSRHEVTLLSTNPFVVQYLSDHQADYELQLRILISGGDVLKREQVDHLLDSMEVYNTYGPTESTVCATYHKIRAEDVQVPIGKPIANRDVFLLNDQHLLPKGALGEIALAGMGLANGYLNQDQLTAALFVEVDGKRMYKTGDLGRWNEQGELLFQGRKDSQLSFRGYRIEPQEIEQAIKEITPSVRACHVSMREWQQAPALIAYVSASGQVDVDSLLKSLKKKLPAHMIPNHVLLLDAFPLNASGKIDSKRLPLPEKILAKAAMVFPSTAVEYEMANIWKKLLNLEEVDIHSSFFALGGHSLLANQFIGIIREERKQDISLREFYEAPTIYEAAKLLETKEISHSFQLEKAPKQELYPLSYPQERLWFLDQLNQDNKSYYVPRAIKMRGQMNLKRIEKAFTLLTEKHEILRTVFPVVNGIPHQKILPPYYFSIPLHSLENLSPQEQEAEIQDFIFQEGNRLFDLEKGPLLRVYILRKSERENILVFCEHHLIHDGWTQGILLREFIDVYSKLIEDENFQIEIPRLQFKDFSHWQKSFFDDERLDSHLSFWKQKLEGHIPVLPLPQKCKRPLQISGNGKLLIRTIDEEWSDKIRAFSVAHGATLFISMLAAFKLTLSRFSNESDICIGTAVANRRLASIENVLGMVINTIALRTQLDGTDSLGAALDKIKQTCFEAYTHEDTPFGKVVEHLSPTRSLGLMPLFQYMFSFMNTPSRNLFLPDLELEVIDSHNLTAKFDINVVVVTPFEQALQEGLEERNRTIMVEWEYNSDIYSEEVMNQMFDAYFAILETMVSSPSVPYKEVPCMGAEQRRELLEVFNDTKADYPKEKTVVDLFREQVERRPEANALVHADKLLTYRELEHLSNGLANHLMDSVGQLKKEAIIGIQLQRSEWVVVSMLAILKAGAAYVSIDPDFPQKRIEYILQDANCPIVIDKDFIDAFAAGPFDPTAPAAEISVDQLAYLIYTSGSTGTPKGIMIEHGSLSNLVFDYQMGVHRTSLSCKTVFDASVLEIMTSITSGSTLFIPEEEIIYNPQEYADFICENKISHCYLHPMHLEEIAERLATYDDLHLQHIFIGVEGIKPSSVEWYFDNKIKILNAYGPTECTVCASYYRVENLADITTPNIPIGKPLSNCQLYILDGQSNRLQPKGVIGELCISGAGLSRGYLNLPDLTDKAFIPHPFKEGERLYKTGDLAKWLPDGNIEFLGRKDTQVKLRGHRIELGEIEHVLMNQQAVTQAVAIIVKQKEEKYLAAYLVGEEEMDVAALKDSLHAYLPAYMIPNHLIQLDSIPLTPNGKIDRKALPKIQLGADEKEYVAPRNEIEAQLVAIWQEVLDVEKVGITDNFFALGGHSLKVTQLINRMNQQLSFTIGVKEIFTNPSIASLSERMTRQEVAGITRFAERDYYPLSAAQKRLWILSQFDGGNKAYSIPGVFKMVGYLDAEVLEKSFRYLMGRHESLRTRFVKRNGTVHQQIVEERDLAFAMEQARVSEQEAKDGIHSFYQEEFDLEQAPLLKARILQTDAHTHYLLFAIHHIIGDGWSMEVFAKELIQVYNQLLAGRRVALPTLAMQYKDYVLWMESEEQQAKLSKQGAYWEQKLLGELPVLELPSYKGRPPVKTYHGATKLYDFPKEWSDKLRAFAKREGATLYMGLLSAINGLFHRYTGATDILLGTPIAGRGHADLENQIGLYINTLAIRTTFDAKVGFASLLKVQKQTLLEAYEHQEYPFEKLLEKTAVQRDTSRSALFDVLVILQNQQETSIDMDGLQISAYQEISRSVSQFDMTFSFSEDERGIHLRLEYNTDIYEAEQINALCSHLEGFLKAAVAEPDKPIDSLAYLRAEEEKEILQLFNDTAVDYPAGQTIISLFRDQLAKTPDAVAVIHDQKQLTYQELEHLSNALANDLLATGPIEKETLVGVALERSEWLVISLLAVLKTGGAYVPIDPSHPAQRIAYLKEDSQCALVVTEEYLSAFSEREKDARKPTVELDCQQLAYLIYTSGSTGQPKGVMIEHQNVVALLHWSIKQFGMDGFDTAYFSTSHCFDLSVYEIFYPLSIGKSVRVVENGLSIPRHLEKDKNVLINAVPSVIRSLLDSQVDLSAVSILNLAGEVVPPSFSRKLPLAEMDVYNLYGPSEDTTYSSWYLIKEETDGVIPIGRPIDNAKMYILSEAHQLQPKGVIGELCISGAGLSRGYWRRSELTSKTFVDHPFEPGERLYKTGDLAKWLPDGSIEFIGRKDDQIKLRGFRIELGEIENAVLQFSDDVQQAVVQLKQIGTEKELLLQYVAKSEVEKTELKQFLQQRLPSYMIPHSYMYLASMPLTPNGKIDKKALLAMASDLLVSEEHVVARGYVEKELTQIWKEVLGVEEVGVTDSFFALGGHSLLMLQLANLIQAKLGVAVQIKDFYARESIQSLAKLISSKERVPLPKIDPLAPSEVGYDISREQNRIWLASQTRDGSISHNMAFQYQLNGPLIVSHVTEAVQQVMDRHEILRTHFVLDEGGEVRQYVREAMEVEEVVSLEEYKLESTQGQLANWQHHHFDLVHGPLFRLLILQEKEDQYIFSFVMHHIIGDMLSLNLFFQEVMLRYRALSQKEKLHLPPLDIHYKDYAKWINDKLASSYFDEQKLFWQGYLRGLRRRPHWYGTKGHGGLEGHSLENSFAPELAERIKDHCRHNKQGLMSVMATALGVLIHKKTRQKDVLIGIPSSLRQHADLMGQMGLYLNVLPFRLTIDKDQDLNQLLYAASQDQIQLLEASFFPFDEIVEQFEKDHHFSLASRMDVYLNVLVNDSSYLQEVEGLSVKALKVSEQKSKFPLCVYIRQLNGELSYLIEYQTAIFTEKEMENFEQRLLKIIAQMVDDPTGRIEGIQLVDEDALPSFQL